MCDRPFAFGGRCGLLDVSSGCRSLLCRCHAFLLSINPPFAEFLARDSRTDPMMAKTVMAHT
jgi:hypothetical protein